MSAILWYPAVSIKAIIPCPVPTHCLVKTFFLWIFSLRGLQPLISKVTSFPRETSHKVKNLRVPFLLSGFSFSSLTAFQSSVNSISISDGLVCWFRQSLSVLFSIDVYKEALNNWSQLTQKYWVGKDSFWPLSLIPNVWDLMTLTAKWLWTNSANFLKVWRKGSTGKHV